VHYKNNPETYESKLKEAILTAITNKPSFCKKTCQYVSDLN
jgi:hypothetical protein